MALATLSIDLVARLASLEEGLNRASRLTEDATNRMSLAYSGVQSAIRGAAGALAAGFSIGAFTELIRGSIDAQDHLNDLAKKAQVTVIEMGGIGFAAKQAGADSEQAGLGFGKLNLAIAKASGGDAKLSEVFDKVGISVKNASGQTRDATSVFADLASKFSSYADSPEKAALGNAIFGKSYQALLPLLADGGEKLRENIEFYARYSGVTAESAQKADEFNDTLTKLHLLQQRFGNTLANELIGPLQHLADLWVENAQKGDGFKGVAEGIVTILKSLATAGAFVVLTFEELGDKLGTMAAKVALLAEKAKDSRSILDPFGSSAVFNVGSMFKTIDDESQRRLEAARKSFADFLKAMFGAGTAGTETLEGGPTPAGALTKGHAPSITGAGAGLSDASRAVDSYIAKLNEQTIALITAGDATSHLQKAQFDLATNPKLAFATDQQRRWILEVANGLDLLDAKFKELGNTVAQNFRKSEAESTDRVNEAMRQAQIARDQALSTLIRSTPTEKTKELVDIEVQLRARLGDTTENADKLRESLNQLYGVSADPSLRALSELQQAVQDLSGELNNALGQGLRDLLTGNFADIGKAFTRMLENMAVQALQADIMNKLFGAAGAGGSRAGGGLIDAFIGLFTSGGGKAGGGSAAPWSVNRVNENGFETFDVQGKTYLLNGGHAGKVNPAGSGGGWGGDVIVNVAAGVSRNELAALVPQLKQTITAELVAKMRRPGFAGAT